MAKEEGQADHTAAWWIIGSVLIGFLVWLFFPIITPALFGAGKIDIVRIFVDIWLNRIRPVVTVLDVLLVILFFYSWYKVRPLMPRLTLFEKPTILKKVRERKLDSQIVQHWQAILKQAKAGTPENLRVAILEADALVDLFLKKSGYQGDTMADRLAQVLPTQAPSIDRLWEAHRLRNELVHTPGASVGGEQAKEALTAYQDFLKQLGAL